VSAVPEIRLTNPVMSPVDDFIASFTKLGGHVHRRGDAGIAEAIANRSPVAFADDRPTRQELAVAEVGVVHGVAAVASTGSIVVDSRRVRAISLLPPVAVFIVRTVDIVATPSDVLRNRQRWWPDGVPAQVVFVTGPSRSGDIELQLLTGVHGPGEVHCVLLD